MNGMTRPTSASENPLLTDWTGPFGLPPLPAIKPEHFRPAFERAMAAHRTEIDAIAASPSAPSFDNTIEALERSGHELDRVSNVFFVLAGADSGAAIEAVEREISPLLARHSNALYLNAKLYARIAALYRRREPLGLSADRDARQAMIAQEGGNFALAPHDWRYYSEKLRKAKFDLDEAEIKPYFQLDKMIEAAFETARRLFGLSFTPVTVPLYHPDTRAFEVKEASGRHVGLFIGDYFARGSKHSGAWMTALRDQEKLSGDVRPVILNVCNFSKPAAGEKALLSFDDARTLFH